ncbi:GH3 auxin-responsive promoter family protein [Micromonospora cathayae]|uniref:GH3 auxin-responsive promoter family protein n=1 Tax=Micromonospora cathayae TaxID=3028804 RepID=A0ABY7ZM09_9ACTN|nr:GH3 auxin-responsive promoter family protein [Micromonospora sp. HUAS 3]WDZ83123.1 GH3 auxin-responsive promoter family protein [Micromonospora sp. HUAS 3]
MTQTPTSSRLTQYRHRVVAERDALRRALPTAAEHQQQALADVLAHNAGTAFGVEHGFARIRNIDDFRSAVPIRDYDALAPWIERAAAGEQNVLSADDPVVFFKSSGSTGDSKKIPITRTFMKRVFFPFYYAAWANFAEHFPAVLAHDDSTLNLKHDPVPVDTTASGRPHAGASQVDFGTAFGEPLSAEPGTRAPWATLPAHAADADHLERAYLRLRLAVQADLRCVIGINPAMVAAVPHQLAQWWPRIVKDLHDGTLGGHPYGPADRERAAQLERLAAYHGTLLPAHVWPNLELIFCWTTGLASLYLPRLREAFGPGVTVLPAPVAASEGPVAVALDRHPTAGPLVVPAAWYEFLPADDDIRPDSPTLRHDELAEGQEYHVVFTHVGGLYRYALGDVVRVVDRVAGVPRVEYAGRRNLSDVAGERLRESHVVRALRTALDGGGLEVVNATCRAVDTGVDVPRYEFALAPFRPFGDTETRTLAGALDTALGSVSAGYRTARAAGRLDPPVLHLVPADRFLTEWQWRVAQGTRPAQVKDRVFQRDEAGWQRVLGR